MRKVLISILTLTLLWSLLVRAESLDHEKLYKQSAGIFWAFDNQFEQYPANTQLTKWKWILAVLEKAKEQKKDDERVMVIVHSLSSLVDEKIFFLSQDLAKEEENSLENLRIKLLDEINYWREQAGLDWVQLDDKLNLASQLHAEYMSETDDFGHNTKNGQTPRDRLENVSYDFWAAGENIAQGQVTVEQVVEDRLNSPSHRDNILNNTFTEMWIWISGDYRVQMFWFPKE